MPGTPVPDFPVRRPLESIQWGLYCTSSWTWCIGMYLPFIMLRLWGWPGFWAFLVPNVVGCTLFGLVLDRERSRALARRLGWTCALFSAVTVAYQLYFAGWAAQWFVGDAAGLRTVVATGAPIAVLAVAAMLALRDDGAWRTLGAVLALAAPAVLLLPGGTAGAGAEAAAAAMRAAEPAAVPLLGTLPLAFALPTIAAGFLASPLFDLTFHRAVQQAPSPRLAFLAFGATFAAMLLLVASFNDPAAGMPRLGPAIAALWAVQLTFTVGAHLRELFRAPPSIRLPAPVTGALVATGIVLALPAFAFAIAPALGPGEPTYLGFLGAYGLLFPVLALLEARGAPRALTLAVLALGIPCYLLGAWEFRTFLMPIPIVAALIGSRMVNRAAKS